MKQTNYFKLSQSSLFAIVLISFLSFGAVNISNGQNLVAHWDFLGGTPLVDHEGNFTDLTLNGGGAAVDASGLHVSGTDGYAKSVTYSGPTLTNKTLVSWAVINDLDERAGSILSIEKVSGGVFDGIIYAEREPQKWMAGSDFFKRTQNLTHAEATQSTTGTLEMLAITYEYEGVSDIRMKIYRNGVLIGNYTTSTRSSYIATNTIALIGARHTVPFSAGEIDAIIKEARIYDAALTQSQIQALTMGSSGSCDDFTVYLKGSDGNPLAGGSLEYREGGPNGWQAATEISDGVFCIDTERTKVGLRMTYSPQELKVAKVPTNTAYTFQMEQVTVNLYDGEFLTDGGEVAYTSDGWHQFGSGTTGDDGLGIVVMDMLPTIYTFRMKYNGDKELKSATISPSNKVISFSVEDLKIASIEGEDFQLTAYPNPFIGNATIAFSIDEAQEINISVYDQTGRLIEILHNGQQSKGNHKITWNASNMNKGVYFVRLSSNGKVVHKNIVKI